MDMDYMKKIREAGNKIAAAFEDEKYTDKDGVVWIGVEGETRDEDRWVRRDGQVSMSSTEMQKMMGREFMGWDEDPVVEDPYEYAIQRTIIGGPGRPLIVGDNWSPREEVNERLLNLNTDRHEYKIVKRRKAGRIQDV